MTKLSKILAVAVVAGIGIGLAGLSAGGFDGIARAGETSRDAGDIAAERIAAAFALVPQAEAPRALQSAAQRPGKGDLQLRPGCTEQKWPEISPECLVSNGTPVRHVRTVTVGQQAGESTTVLVRVPVPQVASR